MSVRLAPSDFAAMAAYARDALPNEACGLIAGTVADGVKTVARVYYLTNTDASPEHFSLDPREQLAAVKDMRAREIVPLGNFHSHPSTPARPSAEDIRLARDPSASYLILSLAGDAPSLRAFRVEGGIASEEELLV
ncbi:MAG: M67 family metallopeptidase [Oscillospiraceae bacterium]|jgi:proteasome lid subunit RPN8/RPN11|nr:M67 family metallopeptidase [Oscillospiraceae bacterium]